jgi:hypothetical protein
VRDVAVPRALEELREPLQGSVGLPAKLFCQDRVHVGSGGILRTRPGGAICTRPCSWKAPWTISVS